MCWPIATSYTSPNAGGLGWGAGLSCVSTAVHITWQGAQINYGDLPLPSTNWNIFRILSIILFNKKVLGRKSIRKLYMWLRFIQTSSLDHNFYASLHIQFSKIIIKLSTSTYFFNLYVRQYKYTYSAVELCRYISNYTSDETKINTEYTLYPVMGYWIEKVNIEHMRE